MISAIQNRFRNFANSTTVKKHINKCVENQDFLTKTLLVTSISKDVFAYALRVNNTLKNDEIPKDKKTFVAEMDAVTGVTTAIVQLGTGFLLANKKIQDTICKHIFSVLDNEPDKFKKASAGFKTISTLVGATLIAKRIIVPLISSPIAGYLEKKHNQKGN